MQGLLATFLEKSVDTFLKQQQTLQVQISKMVAHTPLATMASMTRQNLETLSRMQENMLTALLTKRDKGNDQEEVADQDSQAGPARTSRKKRA
jgi:polyhydroxyalkanoate synthesis regulator protein